MDEKIENALKKLGLEEREIKTYIALLKLGSSTVAKIAEETKIDRTTSYGILEKLLGKGFVSYIIQKKVKFFQAADPRKLTENLEEKKKEVEAIIPDLLSLSKLIKEETIVELYRGKDGLITVLRDVLKEKRDYVVFGEEGKFQEVLPYYIIQLLRDIKTKYHLYERILSKESMKGKILITKNSKIKYLPDEYFSPVMTVVYGNKVAIFTWINPYYAVLINNKGMAQSYKNYFEILWKIAKK